TPEPASSMLSRPRYLARSDASTWTTLGVISLTTRLISPNSRSKESTSREREANSRSRSVTTAGTAVVVAVATLASVIWAATCCAKLLISRAASAKQVGVAIGASRVAIAMEGVVAVWEVAAGEPLRQAGPSILNLTTAVPVVHHGHEKARRRLGRGRAIVL